MSELAHPAWPLLAGAAVAAVAPLPVRRLVALLAPLVALVLAWRLPDGAAVGGALMGLPLIALRADALARVFAIVFALAAGLGALYGLEPARQRLLAAGLAAAAAAEGIVLAGDWVTLYLAWETLAVASFVLVTDGRTARAWRSALGYLLVHALGGALLLAGVVWHLASGGDPRIGPLALDGPGWLVLLAFAVNAAVPPLHAWLTDAYPESSPAGTVLLSAFATKAAVYALLRVFAGQEVLVWAGTAMALYGVVYAVLATDIRRLLAYHIVSQVGYMVAGAGIGTALAVNGAAAHAFCHIIYKALLLMGAGAVVHATGRGRLPDLGGLAPHMPATLALYMVGALSISGAPLLNGFVSKSLVLAAAEATHRDTAYWLLTLASVGTFLSTGLKLPWFTFGGAPAARPAAALPRPMLAAMTLAAALCLLLGVAPGLLYALLPFPVAYAPYTAGHVLESLQILAGTTLAFLLLKETLHGAASRTLDVDVLYRAAGRLLRDGLAPALARVADAAEALSYALVARQLPAPDFRLGVPIGYAVLITLLTLGLTLLAW